MPKTSGRSGKTTDTVSCGDKGACRFSVRRGRACSPPQIRSARRAWRRRGCCRIGRTHRPARRICAVCRGIFPARLADGSCGFLQKMNMIEIRKGRADGRSARPFRIGQLNIAEKLHGCRRRLRRRSFFLSAAVLAAGNFVLRCVIRGCLRLRAFPYAVPPSCARTFSADCEN